MTEERTACGPQRSVGTKELVKMVLIDYGVSGNKKIVLTIRINPQLSIFKRLILHPKPSKPPALSRPLSMKKTMLLCLFSCYLLRSVSAQEVQVNEDPRITQLTKTWVSTNRVAPHIEGWRVQIMASTDRVQVESGRNKFRTEYPEVSAEWTLEKPYYKLRVGAFRSKQEALAFIAELTGWPGAYPAKDTNIHPRDFLEQ